MHFSWLPIETMYLKPLIAKDQHFEHGSNIYGIVQLFPGLWCMCISEKKVSGKEDWCTDKANIKPGQLNFWVLTERILADVAKCEFSPLCSECTMYRFLVENLYIWTHCWKMLSKRVYPGLTWKGKICWLCPTYTQSGSSGLHRAFIQKQNVFTITGHWPVFNSRELAMMCEEMRYYVLS